MNNRYPGYGMHYNELQQTIAERAGTGNWKGFIWHQGTQGKRPQQSFGKYTLAVLTNSCCFISILPKRRGPPRIPQ